MSTAASAVAARVVALDPFSGPAPSEAPVDGGESVLAKGCYLFCKCQPLFRNLCQTGRKNLLEWAEISGSHVI